MNKILVALLLPLVVLCQSKDKDIDYLVVKGRAEVQVPVEYLEISISIMTYGPSFKIANDSNRAMVFKLFTVFRQFSIPDSDFQTTNNSSNQYDYNKEPERRLGIQYSGTLYLRNPNSYDSLFQAIVSLGNVSINIARFHSNQQIYYRMLAYQKAVESARNEAQMLLKGSHQSLGKIIKLIQDNRDVFTQYDDIDKILAGTGQPFGQPVTIVSAQALVPLPGTSTSGRKLSPSPLK